MGVKQFSFGDYEQSTAKKRTRRERFLAEMEAVVPWKALIDLIEPHYPKTSSKGGRPPYPLETMLRIHLMQQWYDLSDPAMEDALIEVATMRRFAGIALITDRIPDESTILSFRHLLEENELGAQIFEAVKAHLKANGMAMKQGTIIDATIIAAPSSTKLAPRLQDFIPLVVSAKAPSSTKLDPRLQDFIPLLASAKLACASGYTHIEII